MGTCFSNLCLLNQDTGLQFVFVRLSISQLLLKSGNESNSVVEGVFIKIQLSLSLGESDVEPLDGFEIGANVKIVRS